MNLFISVALLFFSIKVFAFIEDQKVNFKGTLVEPPSCIIDSGNDISIDFGDKLSITKIDGINYTKSIPYTLTCPPGVPPLVLMLSVNGISSSFDTNILKTNIPDLGIKFFSDSALLKINNPVTINPTNPPSLKAVPVKKTGTKLPVGDFSATASLIAVYQ
ncbi:fimbrial protein [Enterobacter kobei]|uniref:fimbrial protein n=1 Tax=Enterobacter kobei TaxID=208224 RepID=UPI002FCEB5F7